MFLNVGTRATKPSIPGLDDVAWLDNDSVLHLRQLPAHLVILGGSYIGLEIGQLFGRFGSAVTVIERGPRIAGREDPEISAEIARFLTAEGIDIRTSTTVERVESTDDGVRVHTADGGTIDGSHLLVAIGRTPNTDRLDLDRIGLATDDRGFVRTDGVFRTAVDGIWALGDINGRGAFTHTSYQDYEILADHLSGGDRTADGRIPTYAMFTDPPLGRVGMNEQEARATGRKVSKATVPMSAVTRAQLEGEIDGLVSILVDTESERFLGASVLGITGDEIVQIGQRADARRCVVPRARGDAPDPSDGRRVLSHDPRTTRAPRVAAARPGTSASGPRSGGRAFDERCHQPHGVRSSDTVGQSARHVERARTWRSVSLASRL